jgi:hypothetical protein
MDLPGLVFAGHAEGNGLAERHGELVHAVPGDQDAVPLLGECVGFGSRDGRVELAVHALAVGNGEGQWEVHGSSLCVLGVGGHL